MISGAQSQIFKVNLPAQEAKFPVWHIYDSFYLQVHKTIHIQPWPNWATLSGNIHKFLLLKFVARMFEHAQTFFGNICCSAQCCPVWPHCRATIHLNFPSEKNQLAQCCIAKQYVQFDANKMPYQSLSFQVDFTEWKENHGEEE